MSHLLELELIDRIATLVPPPRVHRHRYFGVLAPNSSLRAALTALAPAATTAPPAPNAQPATESAYRRASPPSPPPACARPLWPRCPPEIAATSVRSSPLPPKMDA
jgi:hypothetical protein